jgi:putative membrane protein
MVTWMAGLFYLPRLFVYHVENGGSGTRLDGTFQMMEQKLLRVIMNPAMIATWAFGLLLIATPGVVDFATDLWIYPKLAAVLALTWFHMWLAARRRDFAANRNRVSGRSYRLMNEVPTLALVVIVVMVIVRPF